MKKSRFITPRLLLLGLILLLVGCNIPWPLAAPAPIIVPPTSQAPIVYAPKDATATATPFQPLPVHPTTNPSRLVVPNTPRPIPTATPVPWGNFPGPSEPAPINIPPPAPPFPKKPGQVNIVLLGSDQRQDRAGFRTDTIVLLTLNTREGTASLTSFPRDLFVYIPGWTMQRINTAFPRGGFDTLAMTFEYNFGIRPDFYVMVNFWAFVEIIDNFGGINVQVASPLKDQRSGYEEFSVPAGLVHMDGETALWYVRSRYTSSDFERTRRQQEVIRAMFNRLVSLNAIKNAPNLYNTYRQSVRTNMGLVDITPLLPLAVKLSDNPQIQHYYISRSEVTNWVTPARAQVLLPNQDAVLEVIQKALSLP
ncbi:MAG: LCP family protein [Anaerolineales bacterium]|nr:LCP family protein [Anaerolineales bacterium]